MTGSKFKPNDFKPDHTAKPFCPGRLRVSWFQPHRKIAIRLIQGSLGFFLVLLTACSNLPSSFTLPSSLSLPDVLTWPIVSQINPPASSETPAIEPEQLKLGLLLSLSGNLARYGTTMQDTTRLLVETVNSCGGVLKQSVQLFSADDRSSSNGGKEGMTTLAEKHRVGVVIGSIGSEVSNAAVDIAVSNQVVQISPASASPVLTERAKRGDFEGFWFRTMPPDSFQGEALAKLANQNGFKTVSILALNNAYGDSIVQAFETIFKQQGGTIEEVSRFDANAGLYDIDFARMFGEEADALLLVAEPNLGGTILRTAYDLGFFSGNTKILLPVSMKTDSLAGQVGQSLDGRYIASSVLGITPQVGGPSLATFQETYEERFDRGLGLYDANTWDAAAVAILAAEAAKDATGAAIKSKIPAVANAPGIKVTDICQALTFVREGKDIDYQGLSGTIDFNTAGDAIANYSTWTIDYTGGIKIESAIQAGEIQASS